jgi:4-diphosphocytidyl-2-C-methyl-D-erythritol kinase
MIIPDIDPLLQAVRTAPGCRAAGMSGSGASCFGVFSGAEGAEDAAQKLRKMGFWAMPTKIKTEN